MELFGTAGIRGDAQSRVTPELALAVGRAVGSLVRSEFDTSEQSVVIGRDGRVTGPSLAAAAESGVLSGGVSVTRVGVLPTPALAFASQGRTGIMLTASHNPPTDNGIKVLHDGVELDQSFESTVEATVEREAPPTNWDEWGATTTESVLPAYRSAVTNYASQFGADPTELKVAVDCGNGMAALATPHVLRKQGAHVVTLNGNVDGHFPGRPSKPTPETLGDLRAFVQSSDADFGIAHDGDADRIVLIDGEGDVVHEDTVVALLAEHYTTASAADDPVVVTTPNASARIDERVRSAGGRVERVRLGALHEGIAAAENHGATVVFAAEPWKHIHTSFGGWIDGVTSAAVLTRLIAASGLDALREPVNERPYRKVSIDCPDDRKTPAMSTLTETLPEAFSDGTVETEHGVRIELADGSWILVRPSGTEPYIRLYAESESVDELVATAHEVITSAINSR